MSDEVKISGINISSASMSVDGYKLLTENGKGIIAVYNTDGTIEKVLISEDNINSTNGTAHFKELPSFDGKTVKAFVWKIENDKLTVTPIANSYTYTKTPKATMPVRINAVRFTAYMISVKKSVCHHGNGGRT